MSITTTTEEHDRHTSGILVPMASGLRRLGEAYIAWRMARIAIAELHAMSDRELQDIGLSRAQIAGAVRCSAPLGDDFGSKH